MRWQLQARAKRGAPLSTWHRVLLALSLKNIEPYEKNKEGGKSEGMDGWMGW